MFKKAILIVHGFAGGTYDQEELANYLELNRNFDVFQFTLPGHDMSLGKAKCEDWIASSEKRVEWLIRNGYKNIYLIGHSMGGVIVTYLASKYKEVKKIVLAAPAFHYLSDETESNINKALKAPQVIKTYSKDEIISKMFKLKLRTVKEFLKLINTYYDTPSKVDCSVFVLHGINDKLVPITSSKYVYDTVKSETKKLVYLVGVKHEVFRAKNRLEIFDMVQEFLESNIKGGIYTI